MKKASLILIPFRNNVNFKQVVNQIINKTNSTLSDLELVVVDNNTDASLKKDICLFLELFKDKITIKYFENNNHLQLAGATNKAIDLCDSKYFIYLCSNDTFIYNNDWINSITNELSDEDYNQGYRLGGTIAPWPNFLKDPKLHVHAQGGVFLSFTEYMKKNKYPVSHPFSFCDVMHSANCLKQGFKIKQINSLFSSMGTVTPSFHQENIKTNKYYITHLHGNSKLI